MDNTAAIVANTGPDACVVHNCITCVVWLAVLLSETAMLGSPGSCLEGNSACCDT